MGNRRETPPEHKQTARITTLLTNEQKAAYVDYCDKIGAQPCGRLREFIEAELDEDRKARA